MKNKNSGAEEHNDWMWKIQRASTADSTKQDKKKQTAWTQVIWNYSVIKPKRNCKKRKKKVLWDIIKGTNVCIMGLSERADKDKESDSLFKKKTMTAYPQIWGGKWTSRSTKLLKPKWIKHKESFNETHYNQTDKSQTQKLLKALREKSTVTNKGNSTRLKVDLMAETLRVSRKWDDIFKMLGEKKTAIQ